MEDGSSQVFWYLILGALVVFSAFFSGSETALIGSRRVTLHTQSEKGDRPSRLALRLLQRPTWLLSTLLVGNNLVNTLAAAIGTYLWGPFWATLIVTMVLLLFGEITPKTIAAHWPERFVRVIAFPVTLLTYILAPLVWLTSKFTEILLWPFTKRIGPSPRFFSKDELITALEQSQGAGELEPSEAVMAQEILDLHNLPIREIMIAKDEAAVLMRDWTLDQVVAEIQRRRFTRYPVYAPDGNKPFGMLHIKDLLLHRDELQGRWQLLIRSLPIRPADMTANDLLRDMQILRYHMAGVADESKNIIGFVTMEGILEEIVGEIADEHSVEDDPVKTLDEGIYQVRGDLEVSDVAQILNIDLPTEKDDQTVEELYLERCEGKKACAVRVGQALIRYGKLGYVFMTFDKDDPVGIEEEEMNS